MAPSRELRGGRQCNEPSGVSAPAALPGVPVSAAYAPIVIFAVYRSNALSLPSGFVPVLFELSDHTG